MGVEIEKKYVVNKNVWDRTVKDNRHFVRQGYILNSPGKTVRVRLTDNVGYITIKGISTGASRP